MKTQTTDVTEIIQNLETLLACIHNAQEAATAAATAMEAFPDLDNERRRLEGILGVLGSMLYTAQCSPLITPDATQAAELKGLAMENAAGDTNARIHEHA